MNDTQVETIEQIQTFLSGIQIVDFIIEDKADRYAWIQRTLVRLHYLQLTHLSIFNHQDGLRMTSAELDSVTCIFI